MLPRHLQALRHPVDGDDSPGFEHPGALDGELSHGSATPDGDRITRLNIAIFRRHESRRENVRQGVEPDQAVMLELEPLLPTGIHCRPPSSRLIACYWQFRHWKASRHLEQGHAKLAAKDYVGDALVHFSAALPVDPANAHVHCGLTLDGKGVWAEAREDVSRAIELTTPHLAHAYVSRARARAALGHLAGAVDDANEAIRLDVNLATAYRARGWARNKWGDARTALDDYSEAMRLDPDGSAEGYSYSTSVGWRKEFSTYRKGCGGIRVW